MIRRLGIVALGVSGLMFADDQTRQKVQTSKTEHLDFQAGGVLRVTNSTGELTVEGWAGPGVEITTVKSTKLEYPAQEREKALQELDRVHITAEREGGELVVTFPRHPDCDLDYRIKVPVDTKLDVGHHVGEVHVENLTGDIEASVKRGEITLRLPEEGKYAINAKSKFGGVVSDFPGQEKRRFWLIGHRMENGDSQAPHKLHLKVGYGDVIILKVRMPKLPQRLNPSPKQDGA